MVTPLTSNSGNENFWGTGIWVVFYFIIYCSLLFVKFQKLEIPLYFFKQLPFCYLKNLKWFPFFPHNYLYLYNYLTLFPYPPTWIWKNKLTCVLSCPWNLLFIFHVQTWALHCNALPVTIFQVLSMFPYDLSIIYIIYVNIKYNFT